MTIEEQITAFKNDGEKQAALKKILHNPLVMEAFALIQGAFLPKFRQIDPRMEPALALALQQAYQAGAHTFPQYLHFLCKPPNDKLKTPFVEWGELQKDDEHTSSRTDKKPANKRRAGTKADPVGGG